MDDNPFRPVVRTQRQLEEAWRFLMGPWGFSGASLWVMFVGADDRPFPQLTQVEVPDGPPEPEPMTGLADLLRSVAAEVGASAVAFLRSRPGTGSVTADDRAWAAAVYAAAREAGVRSQVVHLATAAGVTPLPMDEVLSEPA